MLRGFDRSAVRGAEDEVVIVPSGACGEAFFELAPAVFAQCPDQWLGERDGASKVLVLFDAARACHPLVAVSGER